MFKRILAVVAGFVAAVGVFAADPVLRDDHPDVYVVQKGDTLWDISARFLKAPWLWPEIWQANPAGRPSATVVTTVTPVQK